MRLVSGKIVNMIHALKCSLLFSVLLGVTFGVFGGGLLLLPISIGVLFVVSSPGFLFAYLISKWLKCSLLNLWFVPILTWWAVFICGAWLLIGVTPYQLIFPLAIGTFFMGICAFIFGCSKL